VSPETERRRQPRREPSTTEQDLILTYQNTQIRVKVLDFSEVGVSLEVPSLLAPGLIVEVSGDIEEGGVRHSLKKRCRVCRCAVMENGKYLAGLTFEAGSSSQNGNGAKPNAAVDHYEVLQLSRNATSDTIQRVFRLIAQRYHPDNQETGNAELFRQVVEAHRVLSDPEMRAAYDAQLAVETQGRFKIFETWESSRGVEAEKRKRQGILSLLYGKRLTDPHQPAMAIRDFEEMLGCPREHLEFSMWFLKENKLITRSDNNRFEITWQGVVAVEAEGSSTPLTQVPQLPAPAHD
jgi:DnaJ domain/PilZ domain